MCCRPMYNISQLLFDDKLARYWNEIRKSLLIISLTAAFLGKPVDLPRSKQHTPSQAWILLIIMDMKCGLKMVHRSTNKARRFGEMTERARMMFFVEIKPCIVENNLYYLGITMGGREICCLPVIWEMHANKEETGSEQKRWGLTWHLLWRNYFASTLIISRSSEDPKDSLDTSITVLWTTWVVVHFIVDPFIRFFLRMSAFFQLGLINYSAGPHSYSDHVAYSFLSSA